MVDAIVLAGAANAGPLNEVSPAQVEALVSIHGKPMLWYVLRALQDAKQIDHVYVVGPPQLKEVSDDPSLLKERITLVPSGETMIDNLLRGLDSLRGKQKVLIITADVPLITGRAIDDFIQQCARVEADVYYPIVSETVNSAHFPHAERTYVNLKEGTFTGGNLALVTPNALKRGRRIIEEAFHMRKRPVKLARLLGFRFILKFGMRRLSLYEIEKRAADILGYRGAAIICSHPEVAIDVDKPSDLQLVETWMRDNKMHEQ